MKRREFIKKSAYACVEVGIAATAFSTMDCKHRQHELGIAATIPMPIQVIIDDVGWWSGQDGSAWQEPYRTGINRHHFPADYEAIVNLGKRLGIRPQAAIVLCEWDKTNILRRLPTSQWMGAEWDNKKWIGPWNEEASHIIQQNQKHIEITLHGIGHEYWQNGKFTRAEWADKSGTMRQLNQVEAHLDYFSALMEQNNLGHFPTSFVPTAFLHGFGVTDDHKYSMAEVLAERGIDYINTPFDTMYNSKEVQHGLFGFDAGVITVNRGKDLLPWNTIGRPPEGELSGPTCGMHWPNLLHPNPERNSEIVDEWVKLLHPYNDQLNTDLSPNSLSFRHQLVHHVCTKINFTDEAIKMDFSYVDKLPSQLGDDLMILKVQSFKRLSFQSNTIKITKKDMMESVNNYLYTLYLKRLPGKKYAQINFSFVSKISL